MDSGSISFLARILQGQAVGFLLQCIRMYMIFGSALIDAKTDWGYHCPRWVVRVWIAKPIPPQSMVQLHGKSFDDVSRGSSDYSC